MRESAGPRQRSMKSPALSALALLCILLALTSCRTHRAACGQPDLGPAGQLCSTLGGPFSSVDHQAHALQTLIGTATDKRVRPATTVTGKRPMAIEECRAIALKNSLELEAARVNELTKGAIAFSTRTKLLPQFLFSGELSERNNYQYSYSDVMGQEGSSPTPGQTGTGVTSLSTGHERSTWRYVLEGRWSPTDAALAYYLSRSNCNDQVKAHYQRVRIGQKLVGVVEASFFRLLALQQALPIAQRHESIRKDIADQMSALLDKKFADVQKYHQVKKNATNAHRLTTKVRNELERQRNLLATAMGVSPDYCVDGGIFVVGDLAAPCFAKCIADLEMQAVRTRPEGYEAGLSHLNSLNDLKRTVVKYFPKVTGFWRHTRDKDRFLWNKDWNDVGVQLYFDLTEWISNRFENKAAATTTVKAHKETGAVALAIVSQVRGAALKYFDAQDELSSSQSALADSTKVMNVAQTRASLDDLDKLAAKEAKANVLQETVERTRALGEANACLAELYMEMGVNYNEPAPCN